MNEINNPWFALMKHPPVMDRVLGGEIVPLYACESGSRAWGFSSKDSDYDVRWVYRHNTDWYLSLSKRDTTIENKLEFNGLEVDAVGWDLGKFLALAKNGNAMPFEWYWSAPWYYSDPEFELAMKGNFEQYFSPLQMAYHYRGLASRHWHRYLEGRDIVTHKKYLYILRAVMMVDWYLKHTGIAPHDFEELLRCSDVPREEREEISRFLDRKRRGEELGHAQPNAILDNYIGIKIHEWKNGFGVPMHGAPGYEGVDNIFRSCLRHTGGKRPWPLYGNLSTIFEEE